MSTSRLLHSAQKRGLAGSLRVLATWLVIGALIAVARPTAWSLALGLPLLVLGETWRAWAAGHLLKSRELAVSGPYRYVQNPLYFGRLCILTGCALAARIPIDVGGVEFPLNVAALVLILLVFFTYYLPRKRRVEGDRLQRMHGDAWAAWTRSVPEIIPRLTPYGENERRWTAERFHDNGEGAMALSVLAMGLALAWRAGLLGF
jgi:protein-S-isoprenylcysteine O-methyltransferase Ste14